MDLDDQFNKNMAVIADNEGPLFLPTGRIRRNRGISRADVISTFQHAFEQIGGTSRLSVWADTNPTEFFKLYGRLLPSSSSAELDGPQEIIIQHALAAPNYNAANNRAQLSAPADVPTLPREEAEVGTSRRASAARKNRSNDK